MIRSIGSSIPTFKSLTFHPGLNVLLADAKDERAVGMTRNSAGKSSFVMIVDFLLGATCDRRSLFRSDDLINATFNGDFQFGSHAIKVERSGAEHGKIFVLEGLKALGDLVQSDKRTGRFYVPVSDWKRYLGHICFGMPASPKLTDFGDKYSPSARTLLKYFMRLDGDGGFRHPERNSEAQQRYSWQVALSYMFGLEWRVAQSFQGVRDKEKALDTLKKEADGGALGELVGTVAKLRPQMVIAGRRAREKREEIASFQVLEAYRDLSEDAAAFQRTMQDASTRLVTLKETLSFLEDAHESEKSSYSVDIASMYRASGVELPDLALKRIEDVAAFQASVVANRKLHLQSEIDQVRREIDAANDTLESAGEARKRILTSLQDKGAFEDLVELQRDLAKLEAEHAALEQRFHAAQALEGNKAELRVDRIELQRRLQADHTLHSEHLTEVIVRIADLIARLYDNREGRFEVNATDNGPEFEIHIEGDRGTGIRSMEVFCMDIALFESVRSRFEGPGFLIHDSHLFDGVDARQIMNSLLIGQESAGKHAQYIVTLNSDIFDSLPAPESFDADSAVLSVKLSDEGESGGLFGFRFD